MAIRTIPVIATYETDSDPTVGAGVPAPYGQFCYRSDDGSLYFHNGTGANDWVAVATGGGGGGGTVTIYEATGAEGTDFMVTLSTAMASDDYGLLWSPSGVVSVPVLDLPNLVAGDRTTTQFRVTLAAPLTAGELLTFIAFAL